ncbi:hypothetical protein UAY_02298 [Enterococcus moraviensis ATCC BAA-383]|uniref:Integrase catalytic domain-containing protein n=1 Tax=Enterococcus moraviensis ATCC BAA-383 TaxID=1158609 RepID=R2TFV4_9ENTE|nr:Mu transposase C-terminal domain-containing protein [Enterococcus moraviensis]EOH99029.1 hypothetical protein UAY_02298 [Enterococcus moraviensis ATCC BAA-383]EOT71796.1 hypothetical protein I586_01603 [Enterococcus moraviensis ATCC BAA-383]OJG67915.1 hypothetical protein RV09_GL002026 [Enterococcus moraviensis]
MEQKKYLIYYSEDKRFAAMKKYKIIEPYLSKQCSLSEVATNSNYCIRTLRTWISNYKKNGLVGLITKERCDKGKIEISNEVEQMIKKYTLMNKNISIASIQRKIAVWCNENQITEPSYYQVRKIIANIPKNLTVLAQEGAKKYSNKFDLIYLREADYPNQIWQADHTLLDINILNSKGSSVRPWLTIILDDYSRAVVGYYIDFEAPNSLKTALTLRQAIWKKKNPNWPVCGIPETFYTDHGSDFTSIHLEQVALDLKMSLLFSKVGVPRGRGKIERFFNTVNTMFLESLPGYTKNNSTKKLLTEEELLIAFNDWLLNTYHYRIHGTTKQRPIDMWNRSDFLPNMPDSLENLDLLLLEVKKERVVHSDGIHLFGLKYIQPNLSAFVGESVEIRYDPRDISDIRVFYNREFLCTAVSTTLENYSISLNDIRKERNSVRRNLSNNLQVTTETVIEHMQENRRVETNSQSKHKKSTLRSYKND